MERLVKFACYCRRTWSDYYYYNNDDNAPTASPTSHPHVGPATDPLSSDGSRRRRTGTRLWDLVERITAPGNAWADCVQFVVQINVIILIIPTLYLRGFLEVTSLFIFVAFFYMFSMCPELQEDLETDILFVRLRQLKILAKKMLHSMGRLRDRQPGLFCIAVCSMSVILWLLNCAMKGMLLKFVVYISLLLVSTMMAYVPIRKLTSWRHLPRNRRESDSEIEEFLPAATETNIQILTKAGDVGEYSPTSTSALAETPKEHEEQEFLNDGDLAGHKMPSHEDGSSDGLELSDLELSEKSSTSSCSGRSDSEFEIIDRQEIGKLCTPQNST